MQMLSAEGRFAAGAVLHRWVRRDVREVEDLRQGPGAIFDRRPAGFR